MGYETGLVQGEVGPDLLCQLCGLVLEDGVQIPACEHYFCRPCIRASGQEQRRSPSPQPRRCPVDKRAVFNPALLVPLPKAVRNRLASLAIGCPNGDCEAVLSLEEHRNHVATCRFRAKVPCAEGCGLRFHQEEAAAHNCVRELRKELDGLKASLRTIVIIGFAESKGGNHAGNPFSPPTDGDIEKMLKNLEIG